MVNKITLRLAMFTFRHPVMFFTLSALCVASNILGVCIILFTKQYNALLTHLTIFNTVLTGIALMLLINRQELIFFAMLENLVENQDRIATQAESAFFLREADSEGYGQELRTYISSLQEKPKIKHYMIKALELQKSKEMKA
ncbi:hypothetical protein AGJ33_19725 [Cronobacter dublinensis subsp. dublinensis]|nr:hypothetical protein [Cronobacter dublinensis subsp. dublinensis]